MAMPYLERAENPEAWLRRVVATVREADGMERTVFHLQTRDWWEKRPIRPRILRRHISLLLREGVRHIAYYPDDFVTNHPPLRLVRSQLSTNSFPALKE